MPKIMTAQEAVSGIEDGATIMLGGFGLCGIPENLIQALRDKGTRDITVVSNNAGVSDFGIGLLLQTRQVKKMIGTYVGENDLLEQQILDKELDIELVPQGTFAERIRAGGAGIPAFFTPTGAATLVAEGKESRTFDGRECILEQSLRAQYAFVKAYKADTKGNLTYRMTARNFNPMMATAADVTIAEVEEIVQPGELDPETIATPGLYVDVLVEGAGFEKRIERLVTREG